VDASDDEGQPELTPEVREVMSRNAFGRGLLRIREQEAEDFWRQRDGRRNAVGLLGSFAVYLVVVRIVRVPLVRQIVGITVGLSSMGIWWGLYGLAVTLMLGLQRRKEDDAASG
jgi:hypothetical protein